MQSGERVAIVLSLTALQWPALAVTVFAAWLVASSDEHRRRKGFWMMMFSNLLWIAWAWSAQAWALMVLQFVLAYMNVRGVTKTETE